MNQQPTFSIITITYNAERWLERTILSVLSQSYPNIEYILIDGASKDKTVEIKAGEGFMQGIFVEYGITLDDDATAVRNGGFGSRTK